MDFTLNQLLIFLALFTIGVIVIWAFIAKERTKKRMQDDNVPKSTLAKDAPDKRSDSETKDK